MPHVTIAFRPEDDQGRGILDGLQERAQVRPTVEANDGTRRYDVEGPDVELDYFDSDLDRIDPDWRNHLTNWRE